MCDPHSGRLVLGTWWDATLCIVPPPGHGVPGPPDDSLILEPIGDRYLAVNEVLTIQLKSELLSEFPELPDQKITLAAIHNQSLNTELIDHGDGTGIFTFTPGPELEGRVVEIAFSAHTDEGSANETIRVSITQAQLE